MQIWWSNRLNASPAGWTLHGILRRSVAAIAAVWMLAFADGLHRSEAGQTSATGAAHRQDKETRGFCANVADKALDARFAWQRRELIELEKKLGERVKLLSARIKEYKKWVALREDFSKRANAQLIEIYAKMRPDAASQQLSAMNGRTAAALISKLPPRKASVILSEMEAGKAAAISSMIKGAAKMASAGKK
ncbi:MAG: MotE family protein [Hyphomicrobiaceae bacterium]